MTDLSQYGYFRVAAVSPLVHLGDVEANVQEALNYLNITAKHFSQLVVFPELNLTGYTLRDLFLQPILQKKALEGLKEYLRGSNGFPMITIVGLPLVVDQQLFNVAAVCYQGKVLAFVPKTHIPNYKEFEEKRWFQPAKNLRSSAILFNGGMVPIGTDILIEVPNIANLTIGVEICEDVWMPIPPSSKQALNGATVMVNLSASNAVVGKADYRQSLVSQHSAGIIGAYIYTSCGAGESTSDVVFDGHSLICENGKILAESERFSADGDFIFADIDLGFLARERLSNETYADNAADFVTGFRRVQCGLKAIGSLYSELINKNQAVIDAVADMELSTLVRLVDLHPFVPSNPGSLGRRSEEVFSIQATGLVQRLRFLDSQSWFVREINIGISGGLDSTLALLVAIEAYDVLAWDRRGIKALTMPGFGTSQRTRNNAELLCKELGVSFEAVSIVKPAEELLRAMGHEPCMNCLMCENAQARIRTNILMTRGFTVGTGDMSEAALGWCTYGGDQLAMYNVNAGVPKTLVSHIVNWTAQNNRFGEKVSAILQDIIDTPISPELLKLGDDGQIMQKTEEKVGPYELNDFFLYHFLRNGFAPQKIFFLAGLAFGKTYDQATIKKWLVKFFERFFNAQFKREANPDGPKVGTVALGQRGDWRMPSDVQVRLWVEEAGSL